MSSKLLTTGQCAKFVKVAPRTIAKWIDSGKLPATRGPDGKGDRLVEPGKLAAFMADNGIDPPPELTALIGPA